MAIEHEVTSEQKRQNKGRFWQQQSAHYRASCVIAEGSPTYVSLPQKRKAAMKTAHCKALSAAFIECIGSGILFDMLGRAGQNARIKNGLWLRAEKIYNNYFLKPNAQTLAEVSAIEEELGRADDYVRANGTVISLEI